METVTQKIYETKYDNNEIRNLNYSSPNPLARNKAVWETANCKLNLQLEVDYINLRYFTSEICW